MYTGSQSKKKRSGLSALAISVGGLALIVLILLGVRYLSQRPEPPVQITHAYTSTDSVEGASPTPMDFYTPVTSVINLYGEADNLTGDTVIELRWSDKLDGGTELGWTTATVDAERGVFYSTYQLPTGETYGLVPSGHYQIDIYVDGGDTPAYIAGFQVHSMPEALTADAPINDVYMIAMQPDGSYRPVTGYPAGTGERTVAVSFADMDEDTGWMIRSLYMADGEWTEIEAASTSFQPVTQDPAPGLYFHSISPENGSWPPGEYRVEVYLSESHDTPSAVAEYTIKGDTAAAPVLRDIVMTTDLDENGAPVDEVSEYPLGTRSFACSFYLAGDGENTLAWEWHDKDGLMGERQQEVISEEGFYWVKYNESDGSFFPPGEYSLRFYLPDLEEAPIAEISFSVVETSTLPMAPLAADSDPLTMEEWAEWNDWLMAFTEGRLTPFGETLPGDAELIDFGVQYNYFYNQDMYATLDEYGMCWLSESALEYTLYWFLDTEVTHASTGQAMYEGGSYGYKTPEEELPFVFPQVQAIYQEEPHVYTIHFDVYTAPVGFDDFNGNYTSWEAGGIVPEYLGERRAQVRIVTDGDITRRVLEAYWEQ